MRPSNVPPSFERPRAIDTIFFGGIAAGALLVLDEFAVFSLQARDPIEMLQYITSGVIGTEAFSGGHGTAALGIAFHFLIAFMTAAVFYEAGRVLPLLYKRPLLWGPVFGVGVYFVMNYAVVPLTAAPKIKFSMGLLINGVSGHALLVGLPIALMANRSAHAHRRRF